MYPNKVMFRTLATTTGKNIEAKNNLAINALADGNLILSIKKVEAEAKLREQTLEKIEIARDALGPTMIDKYN